MESHLPVVPTPTQTPAAGLSVSETADFLHASGLAAAVLESEPEPDPRTSPVRDPIPIQTSPLPPVREPEPEAAPEQAPAPTSGPTLSDLAAQGPAHLSAVTDLIQAHEALSSLSSQYHELSTALARLEADRAALVQQHGLAAFASEQMRLQGLLRQVDVEGNRLHAVAQNASGFLQQAQAGAVAERHQRNAATVAARLKAEFGLDPHAFNVVIERAKTIAERAGFNDRDAQHLLDQPEQLHAVARDFFGAAVADLRAQGQRQLDRAAAERAAAAPERQRGRYSPSYKEGDASLDAAAAAFRKLKLC